MRFLKSQFKVCSVFTAEKSVRLRALLLPLLTVLIAAALRMLVDPWIGRNAPYGIFFLAVALSAHFSGLAGGVLATLLSAALGHYLFVARFTFTFADSGSLYGLVLFVLVALCIVKLASAIEAQRAALHEKTLQLKIANDELEKRIQEKEKVEEALRRSEERLRGANQAKDEFLAAVSHELRSPLNAILGWAQLMRRKSNAGGVASGLAVIESSARSQARLISDLLDLSRITAGRMPLEKEPVDLAGVIEAALQAELPACKAKNITLKSTFNVQDRLVLGDAKRLQQVASSLLGNAVKFTPNGGVINVNLDARDGWAEMTVHDDGEGMRPEVLAHIFKQFKQGDGSITRKHGGLGIGLSIAKSLVEMHGGTIRAESRGEGLGSTFTVLLPLLADKKSAINSSYQRSIKAKPLGIECLEGIRILLVDDEPVSRSVVAQLLRSFGADVTEAGSAHQAMELTEEAAPDVLISDISMPGEDGYSLITRIRLLRDKRKASVPAIALTAFAGTEDRLRALSCGYQAHIAKPVDSQELIASVVSLTGALGGAAAQAPSAHGRPVWN